MVRERHTVWVQEEINDHRLKSPELVPSARATGPTAFAVTFVLILPTIPSMTVLSSRQRAESLRQVPNWNYKAQVIRRTYEFKDFPAAIRFVNAVAKVAEKAWHHPDIDIRWNKVALALTTHDAGGLTEKDFSLAKKFDTLGTRSRAK